MDNLLHYALAGYEGNHTLKPFYSSPCWLAQEAGDHLRAHGFGTPTLCKMSRGYSVRVQVYMGGEFIVKFTEDKRGCLVVGDVLPQ